MGHAFLHVTLFDPFWELVHQDKEMVLKRDPEKERLACAEIKPTLLGQRFRGNSLAAWS